MNKLILLALLFLSINVINGTDCEQGNGQGGDSEETCALLKLSGDKTHCCLIVSENNNINGCRPLTDDQYENIKRYKDYLRTEYKDDDLGIECSSKFISIQLLAIFVLFLL